MVRISEILSTDDATLFPDPPVEHNLNTVNMVDFDLSKLTYEDTDDGPLMEILKDRCKLLSLRPLTLIQRKIAWTGVRLENDTLVYQQLQTKDCEGFHTNNDMRSSCYRRKKILQCNNQENGQDSKVDQYLKLQVMKFGQVKPFPVKFEWKFLWNGRNSLSSIELKDIMKKGNKTPFLNLSESVKSEIIDHLVVELFVYFRRSVPSRYLDRVLERLIVDFPWIDDQDSYNGTVS